MDIINLKDETGSIRKDPSEQFALDVLMGLSSTPKRLNSKYLYDKKGSELFQKITELDEYYPTQCEREIFETQGTSITEFLAAPKVNLVELGAGDGRKTKVLLDSFLDRGVELRYFPIDISEDAVEGLLKDLSGQYPRLDAQGIAADYFTGLDWVRSNAPEGRTVCLNLGSNIGNSTPPEARVFMRTLWNSLQNGDMVLTGFDLKKDIQLLLDAYNDRKGVTAQFNLNLLDRMNRELGADFDSQKFQHYGCYNIRLGAMESHLVSLEAQTVNIRALNKRFEFAPFESLQTEFSLKFLPEEVDALAEETGFGLARQYSDSQSRFVDAVLEVKKST